MKVSVVIPTYNRARLIVEALESVFCQTFRDLEIIVVDDGSTDGTEQALRGYQDRIRYVYQPNRGVNAARNRAIDMARGEYIALLDNDDLWRDDKLALQVSLLDHFVDAGFVFSDFAILKPSGAVVHGGLRTWHNPNWPDIFGPPRRYSALGLVATCADFDVYQGDIYPHSISEPYVLPSASLFRRRYFGRELRFPEDDPICGDWEFFARLSRQHGAVFMDCETAVNRSHEDSVRLTRTAARIQVARRLAMVRRVWCADAAFSARYPNEVGRVERNLLAQLITLSIAAGDKQATRAALGQWRGPVHGTMPLRLRLLVGAIGVPGGAALIRLLLDMRSRWRRMATGVRGN